MAYASDYDMIGTGFMTSAGLSLERTMSGGNKALDLSQLINEDETDIEFINKLYRGENPDYFLGGWIIKAVTDNLLHYMGLPDPEAKGNRELDKLLDFTYEQNKSKIYDTLKYLGLYGQSYLELGYNQRKKLVTFHPHTKQSILEVRRENWSDPDDITYARVRTIVEKFEVKDTNARESDESKYDKNHVYFDKIYWKENNQEFEDALTKKKDASNIDEFKHFVKVLRIEDDKETIHKAQMTNPWGVMPIVEFNQGRLIGDINGFADANGLIKLSGVYHQILERAIDANMYNGQPTIVFSGLDDPNNFIAEMYGQVDPSGGTVNEGIYNMMGGYYLKGGAKVSYLQVNDTVSNAKALLELIFYIFVQMSGVPEWTLGVSMSSTYASVKMQSSPLVQRIQSKRLDVHDSFVKTNDTIAQISAFYNKDINIDDIISTIKWGEVLPDEDMSLDVRLKMARDAGLLTDETYMRLLKVVGDGDGELKRAKAQFAGKVGSQAETQAMVDEIASKVGINPNSVLIDDEDGVDVGEMMVSDNMVNQLIALLGEMKK